MSTKGTYRRISRFYDLLDLPFEHGRYSKLRPQLFAGLGGRVLDAGIGTGRNMPHYPAGCEMVGIDLSPEMLARAAARRAGLGVEVELAEMDVCHTTFPNRHFDTAVATFLFCVLDEPLQLPALKELARICKRDGEIRLLEYAYSEDPRRRFIMGLWGPWVRWAYGAAFNRNTEHYVAGAGLELVDRRFVYEDIIKLLVLRPR